MPEWNEPKDWLDGEEIQASELVDNLQIDLLYLYQKNMSMVEIRNGVSDFTEPLIATWKALFPSVFTLDIMTTGGNVLIQTDLDIRNSGAAGSYLLDFFVFRKGGSLDGYYLSSNTSTPSADGLARVQLGSGYARPQSIRWIWEDVPIDTWRIQVWWHALVGTNSINLTNHVNQFRVEEYGRGT